MPCSKCDADDSYLFIPMYVTPRVISCKKCGQSVVLS